MRTDGDLLAQGVIAVERLPDLGPAVEEALVAGDAVQHGRRLAVQRQVIGLQTHGHAGGVTDVLTHGQPALEEEARQGFIGIVLGAQTGGQGLEIGLVLGGPPVAQHAVAVGFGALVVEAVADLVADHPADGPIVDRRIAVRIEEGRLQDGRREDDLVVGRVVIGVHRLRGHAPFVLVDRIVQAIQLVLPLEDAGPFGVAEQVVTPDLKGGIVAPAVRIADLDGEFRQFLEGRRLGRLAHPAVVRDAVAQRDTQVGDQFLHLGPVFGREIFGDILPADRLAQHAFGEADAALVSAALHGLALQVARTELPLGVGEAA